MHHKPYECLQCGAWCKTIQGHRGHERFRHGVNASPARRYWVIDGSVLPCGNDDGFTYKEAMEASYQYHLMRRLERLEKGLRELLSRPRG